MFKDEKYHEYIINQQNLKLILYKFVQYLRKYINSKEVQTLIKIKSKTACNWLYKFGFEYKNIKKYVFIDKYEGPDIVEDYDKFLNIIKNLKLYLIEFEEDRLIKTKNYLDNYTVGRDIHCSVIVITHNKYIFSANNRI